MWIWTRASSASSTGPMASIQAPNRPVRLALVGAGRWGRVILRNLAGMQGAVLAAVASGSPETAGLVPVGCPVFAHWRDMLAAGGFDGVVIATPPASHAEIAEAVMSHGLAVLIEKPLTLDLGEALALRDTAIRHGALVQVGHVHLAAPAWRRLKALVGEIGPVREIHAVAGNHGPYRSDATVLWDWGPHDIALCLDLLGQPPDRVEARLLARRNVAADVTSGMAERLRLDLGFGVVAADIILGTDMDKTRRFEVVCHGGTLVYDDLSAAKLTLDGIEMGVAADPPLGIQLREFAAAIGAGSRDISGLDLGIAVVEVLGRCQSSLVAAEGL
ncbi:hypothetical protein CU669_00350 [Paramagnetospirillum kuznetsovii]|uniref:Uncharacterized protein n=1 Tax=Paramagnetospirillum kuznetsovii TaxID=2053833 RepID=A0A364P2L8_9PROT|nr:Gfo/Idh/MocA family oxidoreductase [Paramagnetospirillum kuznetsovii]RAU23592.1 hypothetical protein CU669_00350 [Paramagnetospirillum kuznetsovii]